MAKKLTSYEIDPLYRVAHQALGILSHKGGDLAKAEHHFRRCIEIDPNDYFSMLYLANNLAVQGRTRRLSVSMQTPLPLIRLPKEAVLSTRTSLTVSGSMRRPRSFE